MKTWQGLNAEEIASIPRDEYCFQKIERILRERNELKELSDEEIIEIGNAVVNLIDSNEGWIEFAKAILKKASEK
jgi:tellurite resistance protein